MSSPLNEAEFEKANPKDITDQVYKSVFEHYREKMTRNAEIAYPVIKNVYETWDFVRSIC